MGIQYPWQVDWALGRSGFFACDLTVAATYLRMGPVATSVAVPLPAVASHCRGFLRRLITHAGAQRGPVHAAD